MGKSNLKAIRITAWICVCYCVLSLCYNVYAVLFRDYLFAQDSTRVINYSLCAVTMLMTVFVLIFVWRILRSIKRGNGQVFIANNQLWLIMAAVCAFVKPYIEQMWFMVVRDIEANILHIIEPLLKPVYLNDIITGLMLLLIAYLYKLGAQVSEEQSLTI